MNKRIKELEEAATNDILGVKVLNKALFAELIINQCLDICSGDHCRLEHNEIKSLLTE